MKNSGNSSAKGQPQPSAASPRKAFALTGRSVVLDPTTHAVRGDLADVRLAQYVFAPHYAAPMRCVASRAVALLSSRDAASDPLAQIASGDLFEVLELAGNNAWGIAPATGLVGYVDRTALELSGEPAA